MNTIIPSNTNTSNAIEVHDGLLVAVLGDQMYSIPTSDATLHQWFMETFNRNFSTDFGSSDLKINDQLVTMTSETWKSLFWVLMEDMVNGVVDTVYDSGNTLRKLH